MKVCGIEIQGNEAVLAILTLENGEYTVVESNIKKIELRNNTKNQEEVRSFYQTVSAFFRDNNFDLIGIKERPKSGKYAGGPVSFKIEALIQNTDYNVELVHPKSLSSKLKKVEIDYSKVNAYQSEALNVAYYLLLND